MYSSTVLLISCISSSDRPRNGQAGMLMRTFFFADPRPADLEAKGLCTPRPYGAPLRAELVRRRVLHVRTDREAAVIRRGADRVRGVSISVLLPPPPPGGWSSSLLCGGAAALPPAGLGAPGGGVGGVGLCYTHPTRSGVLLYPGYKTSSPPPGNGGFAPPPRVYFSLPPPPPRIVLCWVLRWGGWLPGLRSRPRSRPFPPRQA